jgi:Flp pilus assembly protein TadD
MTHRDATLSKLHVVRLLFGFLYCSIFTASLYCQEQLIISHDDARKLFERGEDDQAGAAFRALLADTEKKRTVLSKKPHAERSRRDTELLSFYTRILASGHNFLGLIATRHEGFTEAARQFAAVRVLQPDFPDADFNHGLALFGAQRYSEAIAPLEQALLREPSNARVKKYLGLVYTETGQYEKAAKLLEAIRSSESDDPRVPLALGKALARLNRLGESRQVFEELFKSQPESAESHLMWGQIFAAQSQSREAEDEFRRALELDPKVPAAHFFLGMLSLSTERLETARQEFAAELASHPEDSRARYHLAFVMLVSEQPGYAQAHYSLGKALLQQGNTRESIGHLEAATRLDPSRTYSHYQLARAYQRASRTAEAEKEFKITHELEGRQNSRPSHTPEDIP